MEFLGARNRRVEGVHETLAGQSLPPVGQRRRGLRQQQRRGLERHRASGGGFAAQAGPGGTAIPPGLRQRIALARALFGQPPLVILDQPTSLADAEGEVAALNALRALKQAGTTVIVISHKPVLASFADRILMMKEGMVEHCAPREQIIGTVRRRTIGVVGAPAADGMAREAAE
ncbi:hypothetical protein [Mangrovicoccus ximenensis]|uniref:hypothetical protein n=1 Tax=Mangrovicoccus ximenensis TaxID=1911570 RepID=UPI000D38BB22|nr:hypothetical protein [Mangrovicoccus ximenensis]